jgi:hypothetical protein
VCDCYERGNRCFCGNPWELVTDRTTPSGKTLYRCTCCGWETPAPTKYHKCGEVN